MAEYGVAEVVVARFMPFPCFLGSYRPELKVDSLRFIKLLIVHFQMCNILMTAPQGITIAEAAIDIRRHLFASAIEFAGGLYP